MEHSDPKSNDEVDTPKLPQAIASSVCSTCELVTNINDALGGVAYVPPHLRNAPRGDDSNSEAILKLTRQLKGLLNR